MLLLILYDRISERGHNCFDFFLSFTFLVFPLFLELILKSSVLLLSSNVLKSLFFSLLFKSSFVLFVLLHNLFKSVKLLLLSVSHLLFFWGDLFFDFLHQKLIELILFSLFNLFSLSFVFDLSVPHFLFELDLALIVLFFLFFSLVVKTGLLLLKFVVFLGLLNISVFFSTFLLHLLIELFFDFLFELLFSHSLKLFLFFEQLCIEFN